MGHQPWSNHALIRRDVGETIEPWLDDRIAWEQALIKGRVKKDLRYAKMSIVQLIRGDSVAAFQIYCRRGSLPAGRGDEVLEKPKSRRAERLDA